MTHARLPRYAAFITILLLVHLAASTALASGVAELRERLLSPDTPETDRAEIVQGLLARGEDGQGVLRGVLRGPREDLVRVVVRWVLIEACEPLLEDVLAHATKSDVYAFRSPELIRLLSKLAADTGRASASRALLAIEMARSRESVEALMELWKTNVPGARQSLRRILPSRDFESAEEAQAWWAEQRGKSLVEIITELARPAEGKQSLEKRIGRLRKELLDWARANVEDASAGVIATRYLSSDLREVRKLGASALKERKDLKAEETAVVAEALAVSLSLEDEETMTLVEMLDAARVHAAGLAELPDSRACGIVTSLLARPEREVRERCIDLLGDLGDANACNELKNLYAGNGTVDAALRSRIISALTRIGNGIAPWAVIQLDSQLKLEAGLDRDITGKLINLLGKRGASEAVRVLATVLERVEDADLRGLAAWALGEAGIVRGLDSSSAIRILTRLGLRNESPGVRLKAASALQNAKDSRAAVEALDDQLGRDDNPAVLGQVARSLQILEGAAAAWRLAPHVARDAGIAAILDETVKAALSEARLDVLMKTAEALAESDAARAIAVCGQIRGKSWPAEGAAELAKLDLLLARAHVTKGDGQKALEVLDAMREDAPVDPMDRLLVRADALRLVGRAAEGLKLVETALTDETLTVEHEFALRIAQAEAFLAMDRPDEALEVHGLLTARDRLTDANRMALKALGARISEARGAGSGRVEGLVAAWLDGPGGDESLNKVRELGPKAYPLLRERLDKLTDTESPALAAFLARLRELTEKKFGFATAQTAEDRSVARRQWLDFLK
jgi:tetratricopeptide (TPR) repeat protein